MIEFDFSMELSRITDVQFLASFFLIISYCYLNWILKRIVKVYSLTAKGKKLFVGYSFLKCTCDGLCIFLSSKTLDRGYTNTYRLCLTDYAYENAIDQDIFVIANNRRYTVELAPSMTLLFDQ